MKIVVVCCMVIFLTAFNTKAQTKKNTDQLNQIWFGYFNQTRLSNKWGTWADVQLRTKENFVNNFSVTILRFGLSFYFTDNVKLTAGYAWAYYFPADNHKNISLTEHRLWQQIQWDSKYARKRMVHWLRIEERFRHKILNDSTLAGGYNFNYRLRYNWRYELPLDKKDNTPGAVTLIINDEISVNAGKQIVYNYFDQNRFYLGFKFQLTTNTSMQLGYMNVFQQLAAGNQYNSTNALRVSCYQQIDLRHKSH